MGRRRNYAAVKDAQNRLKKEECAIGTEERDYAVAKVVQILNRKKECVAGMGQSANAAAMEDVQIRL